MGVPPIPPPAPVKTPLTPYKGFVANHTFWPTAVLGNRYWMAETRHVLADNVSAIQLVYPGVYQNASGVETLVGADRTLTASISMDANFTVPIQVKFAGSASGTSLQTALLVSDPVQLPAGTAIGTVFFVRTWADSGASVAANPYTLMTAQNIDTARGEVSKSSFSSLITDQTMTSGAITGGTDRPANWFGPCAIVGITRKRSFVLYGDSRVFGVGDTHSAGGGLGPWQRALDLLGLAYTCGAVPGDRITWFATNSQPRRLDLAAYASDQFFGMATNDLSNSRTVAQVLADIETSKYKCRTDRNFFLGDCGIFGVSSTNGYIDIANQSVTGGAATNNALRVTLNTSLSLRADTIVYSDLVQQSGVYSVAYGAGTIDGTHESNALCVGIAPTMASRISAKL